MLLSVFSLLSLVPSGVQAFRTRPARDGVLWACLALGIGGSSAPVFVGSAQGWQTGFSATLWVTVATTMLAFAVLALLDRHAWRLAPLVSALLLAFGILAALWADTAGAPLAASAREMAWIVVHIGTALVTYSLVTLAAVAALATYLQERAIKQRQFTRLTRLLPSVRDCERLVVQLLAVGETILAVGLATGMALTYRETGSVFDVSHKTILTLTAFFAIGAVLVGYVRGGVRGRRAVRWVLLAYLTLCLGYPGVKFVTDVVIGM